MKRNPAGAGQMDFLRSRQYWVKLTSKYSLQLSRDTAEDDKLMAERCNKEAF